MAAKTYSKAARRKARKQFAELAEVPKKQPNGRKRRPTGHVAEKNPARTALMARARQSGLGPDDMLDWLATKSTRSAKAIILHQEGLCFEEIGERLGVSDKRAKRMVEDAYLRMENEILARMRGYAHGEAAGLAIHAVHRGEAAKRLWDAYTGVSGAYKRYLSICIGASVDAKTAKIEMMPERFETSASDNIDMRSEEERHRAADVAWERWKNMLGHLSLAHSSAIYSALHGWGGMMDAGAITDQGRRFVWAMEALAEVVDRAK